VRKVIAASDCAELMAANSRHDAMGRRVRGATGLARL